MSAPNEIPTAEVAVDVEAVLREYHRRRLRQQMIGPLLSLMVHILLIGGMAVYMKNRRQPAVAPPVEVTIRDYEPPMELPPPLIKDVDDGSHISDAQVPTLAPPDVSDEPVGESLTGNDVAELKSIDAPTQADDMADVDGSLDDFGMVEMSPTPGPLRLPVAYRARATEESRAQARDEHGGSYATERAVLKALAWLRDHQNPDGSWSKSKPEAMTALGLLAFMAHGEGPVSDEYGPAVQLAGRRLYDDMMAVPEDNPPLDNYWPYRNGMVTYALAEAYAITRVPLLKVAMEKGVRFIVTGQQPGGGWDYQYCQGARWDITATTWQIQALKAAYNSGSDNPGVYDAMERGAQFLKDTAWKDGNFQWVPLYPGDWGVQGCGVLCLQLTGYGRSKQAKEIIERVYDHGMKQFDAIEHKLFWEHNNPYYDWYYETQVMFHAGRTTWHRWNAGFAKALLETQHEDGHWEIPGEGSQRAEWDPYQTTALNCMGLQIYYRYLPSYKEPTRIEPRRTGILDRIQDSAMLRFEPKEATP